MLTRARLSLYITFIVALAVWVGGGVFDTISSHPAWYADPVKYTRTHAPPEGTVNPWPFTTAFLALSTLASLGAFARYRGAGRREVLLVLGVTFLILVVTAFYFVPTLIALSHHEALTDAQITSMSLLWIRLNVVRIVVLLTLLTYSLVGLIRLVRPRATGTAG